MLMSITFLVQFLIVFHRVKILHKRRNRANVALHQIDGEHFMRQNRQKGKGVV